MSFEPDPNLHSSDRLADLSREAVHWPDSEYNEFGNEKVYHSTTADSALGIMEEEAYNPMEDDLLDELKTYALRDIEAVDEGKINLGEYIIENEDELREHGPDAVQEGLEEKGAEEIGGFLQDYGLADLDVRKSTMGARRTNSVHVGSDRHFTKSQSNFGSDVTFELLVPENSRHDSDIPGEVPFSYTTAVYINDDAEEPEALAQEVEQRLEENGFQHVDVEREF
ncbi:hypothetical protein GKQ38_01980 [Candidatus Nanohaloarchaea archaeon]|nr:hypothetical protein GKQ38_01980 [Candidatus Nanohaloarchaea archaeon]